MYLLSHLFIARAYCRFCSTVPKLQILLSLILLRIRNQHVDVEAGCYLPRGDGGHVLMVIEFQGLFCADVLAYSHSISSASPTLPTNTTLRGVSYWCCLASSITEIKLPPYLGATLHRPTVKMQNNRQSFGEKTRGKRAFT